MDHEQLIPAYGPVLRRLRMERGLTQEELAARLGFDTHNYVSQLERGVRKPTVEMMFKLAWALNMHASEFVAEMEKGLRKTPR